MALRPTERNRPPAGATPKRHGWAIDGESRSSRDQRWNRLLPRADRLPSRWPACVAAGSGAEQMPGAAKTTLEDAGSTSIAVHRNQARFACEGVVHRRRVYHLRAGSTLDWRAMALSRVAAKFSALGGRLASRTWVGQAMRSSQARLQVQVRLPSQAPADSVSAARCL